MKKVAYFHLFFYFFIFITLAQDEVSQTLNVGHYKFVIGIENKDGTFGPSKIVVNVKEAYQYDGKYYLIVKNFKELKAKYGSNLEKQTIYITNYAINDALARNRWSQIIKVKEDPSENGEGKIISSTLCVNVKVLEYMNFK